MKKKRCTNVDGGTSVYGRNGLSGAFYWILDFGLAETLACRDFFVGCVHVKGARCRGLSILYVHGAICRLEVSVVQRGMEMFWLVEGFSPHLLKFRLYFSAVCTCEKLSLVYFRKVCDVSFSYSLSAMFMHGASVLPVVARASKLLNEAIYLLEIFQHLCFVEALMPCAWVLHQPYGHS